MKEQILHKFSLVTSFFNNTREQVMDVYESVISQDYANWEWIITDDFSTTETKKHLDEILPPDDRIRYIDQLKKREIYWNTHKYASGDIVCVLDADDKLAPMALKVLNHFYTLHPECVMIHTNSAHFKEHFEKDRYSKNRNCTYPEDFKNFLEYQERHEGNHEYRFGECWGGFRTFRNLLDKQYDFREGHSREPSKSEDLLKILKIEELGKVLYIDRPLHFVREREGSLSTRFIDSPPFSSIRAVAKKRRNHLNWKEPKDGTIVTTYHSVQRKMSVLNFSDLIHEEDEKNILCVNFQYSDIEKKNLKDIYLGHNITFDKNIDAHYYFYAVDNMGDMERFYDSLSEVAAGRHLYFWCQRDLQRGWEPFEQMKDFLESKGVGFRWHIYANFFIFFTFDS